MGKNGPAWRGGPGALKRLNLNIEGKPKAEEEPKKANIGTIDAMLQKKNEAAAEKQKQRGVGFKSFIPTRRRLSTHSQQKQQKAARMLSTRLKKEDRAAQDAARAVGGARNAAQLAKVSEGMDEEAEEAELDLSDHQVQEALDAAVEAQKYNKKRFSLGSCFASVRHSAASGSEDSSRVSKS